MSAAPTRPIGSSGLALLHHWEQGPGGGCALRAYQDQKGVWTLGWGDTDGVKAGDTCTPEEADARLVSNTDAAALTVDTHVTVPLNVNQRDALICFTFNVGRNGFDTSTLLRELDMSDYADVPAQLARWNHVNGVVSAGLTARRAAEIALWNTSETEATASA